MNLYNKAENAVGEPFDDMEQAWFWFIAANEAKNSGARITAGQGLTQRPCEPNDIMAITERLFRNRILTIDHFRVLKHYGDRGFAPDKYHYREKRAFYLWHEALKKMRPVFESKGLVLKKSDNFFNRIKKQYRDSLSAEQNTQQDLSTTLGGAF